MANEIENYPAEVGTHTMPEVAPESGTTEPCPAWDRLGNFGEFPPFFNPREELKRRGFVAVFLCNRPKRETPSKFKPGSTQCWFDIQTNQKIYTWTIDQITLLRELKQHEPLAGKALKVQLVPVDEAFKQRMPSYRGKDRYSVEDVTPPGGITIASGQNSVAPPISAEAIPAVA